jgi:hypothetical protein
LLHPPQANNAPHAMEHPTPSSPTPEPPTGVPATPAAPRRPDPIGRSPAADAGGSEATPQPPGEAVNTLDLDTSVAGEEDPGADVEDLLDREPPASPP